MCMCNYKSVFINKLSILKFDANPCRLGHGSFHKNLMHTVKKLVLSPGLEGTMSFLPFILSQQLDEILQVFFTKTWGNYAVLATDSVRINMMERELLVIGSFTDLWSPSRQFLNADSVTLRLVITNHVGNNILIPTITISF